MTFWNFKRVFLETRFSETACKVCWNLTNRLLWNMVHIFSVTFTRDWQSNIFEFLTLSKNINKRRRNFWHIFDTSKTNSCHFHNFHKNKNVESSIPREYRLLLNFFYLFVAANPVWLESCTPTGNVKESYVKGCRWNFNVAFYSS